MQNEHRGTVSEEKKHTDVIFNGQLYRQDWNICNSVL